ncbi:MAG: endolytic transglycosylase MltG [Saprospiraceae bacterium]|nr:endolytic transglycosylase MltG [Saprospiraceae bacterium]
MKSSSRTRLAFLLVLIIAAGIFVYSKIFGGGVPLTLDDYYIKIPTGATYEQVLDSLMNKGFVKNEKVFTLLSERMQYKRDPMRGGRYELKPGWSMIQVIRHLRGGTQTPVDVVLNNERMIENVAAKVARFIEPDSLMIWTLLQDDTYLQSIGYNRDNLMSLFIPNTYEMYWNSTPQQFIERMGKEHDAFWSKENRRQKAETLGLTPAEVYTLASIVEKETNQNSEKRRMAGVYINRIKLGMPLQADPTAVFARRDFDTKRVTDYHTKFDSPYNTYIYKGLPPGPICMASISSIDGVLNAEEHDYIFFCSIGDNTGLHAFAKTNAQHEQNIAQYVRNLRARGLR